MKKFSLFALCCAVVFGAFVSPASALPPINKAFLDRYQTSPIAASAKEAKCDVCHYGTDKKQRNDFGATLSKLGVTRDAYAELRKDREKLAALFKQAFEKAEGEESVTGVTFGEMIKSGKLPGTAPEDADAGAK